jgi:uncharacterized protein YbjT (DUF2867 family)
MSYTILQASYFMEVWLTPALGFDVANRQVRIYGDGNQPVSWISYRDVAHAAADAVINDAGQNMVVELGGPQALSPREVVATFEAAGSGSIVIDSVPVGVLQEQLRQAPDSLQQTFAGLMLMYAGGDPIDTAVGRRLFPFPMTSVGDFVAVQVARSA